jgi:phosphatidylglycerophosphate synthase
VIETILSWLVGDLTPRARVWTALAPGLAVTLYFLVALMVFSAIALVRGIPRDAEVEPRGRTMLLGFYLRHFFFWAMRPLARAILWTRIPPTAITLLAGLLGLASGFLMAAGRFSLGGWIFLASGILDTVDGRVARSRGEVSARGSAIDSVLDRYSDAALLVGMAWYYRQSPVLLAALLALVGGLLVPYIRAKGESLGVSVREGQLQRAERVVVLGLSAALSPVLEALRDPLARHPMHWLAVGGLVFVALGSNATAVTRLLGLLRALPGPEHRPDERPRAGPGHWRAAVYAVAAALGLVAEYLAFTGLATRGGLHPGLAAALAAAALSCVGFAASRLASRRESREAAHPPLGRWALVASVEALLVAGGVSVLVLHALPEPRLAWTVAKLAVLLLWTSPLRRGYLSPAPLPPAKVSLQGSAPTCPRR